METRATHVEIRAPAVVQPLLAAITREVLATFRVLSRVIATVGRLIRDRLASDWRLIRVCIASNARAHSLQIFRLPKNCYRDKICFHECGRLYSVLALLIRVFSASIPASYSVWSFLLIF